MTPYGVFATAMGEGHNSNLTMTAKVLRPLKRAQMPLVVKSPQKIECFLSIRCWIALAWVGLIFWFKKDDSTGKQSP